MEVRRSSIIAQWRYVYRSKNSWLASCFAGHQLGDQSIVFYI